MLKFFRKVKKRLLSDNKFSSYLLYAFGEIILLIVGVFIALQIDNLNEERKANNQGKKLIVEIYSDLKSEEVVLNTIVNRLNEQYIASVNLLNIYDSPNKIVTDTVAFSKDWATCSWPLIVDRGPNTFYEIKSSGESDILRDDYLVAQLGQFYHNYDSRISNFNEYPKWVRLEKRKNSYKSGNLADYLFQKSTQLETGNFIREVLRNDLNYELLLGIIKSCDYNISFFEELSKEASLIMKYIEECDPDIAAEPIEKHALYKDTD